MAQRKCRMTPEQIAVHNEAVRLRKMTDEQLVDYIKSLKGAEKPKKAFEEPKIEELPPTVEQFLEELAKGECKGVKGATIFKLTDYAREHGYISPGGGDEVNG